MGYEVVFPSERVERVFQKSLSSVPADDQQLIVNAIRFLKATPRPEGKRTKKLTGQFVMSQFTAQYRPRIGPYRILSDVDDRRKKVILLKLAKRDEQTYR